MLQLSSLAVFFAFLTLLFALPAIFSPAEARKAVLKLFAKVSNVRILAMSHLILAFLILEVHPLVEKNWESVMSVIAYLLVVRSIVWTWWPKFVKSKVKSIVKSENAMVVVGLVALVISLGVGYLGFYVYQ